MEGDTLPARYVTSLEPADKPGLVPLERGDCHSSRATVTSHLKQPTR